MLNEATIAKLNSMRLLGMTKAFAERIGSANSAELSHDEFFGLLVDDEKQYRNNAKLAVVVDHQRHKVVWGVKAKAPLHCNRSLSCLESSVDQRSKASSKAIDEVRRAEVRTAVSDERKDLKSTRWALLNNPWNLTPVEYGKRSTIQKTNATLYRAYLLKETLETLFDAPTVRRAEQIFTDWFAWARPDDS